jgi:hypothetical protein
MKLFKYALLLLIIVGGFASVVSADIPYPDPNDPRHTHVITGTLNVGYAIIDTVTSTVTYDQANNMQFEWYGPDGKKKYTSVASGTPSSAGGTIYSGTLPAAENKLEGTWTVIVKETVKGSSNVYSYTTCGITVPEFLFGSFISLFIAGILYMIIRRNIVGSCNVKK